VAENPAAWGRPERIVHDVLAAHEEQEYRVRAAHGEVICGPSLVRQITDALRREGLLRERGRYRIVIESDAPFGIVSAEEVTREPADH